MPPTQTPSILSLVWFESHGLSPFYAADGWSICAGDGLLITGGVSGFAMGVSSVVFDDVTGEPLTFQSHTSVTAAGGMELLGCWHYPAESCVVIFGVRNSSTAANVRVYGQRIYYDSGGNFTADPLATWSPGASSLVYAVGRPSSASARVMGLQVTVAKTVDINVAAGTVGATSTPTVNAIFGGSIDRMQLHLPLVGEHPEAATLTTAYQNSAGATTAQTYIVEYAGSTPTATNVSTSRMTALGGSTVEAARSLGDGISGLGGSSWRLMDTSAMFLDQPPPTANFIFQFAEQSPQTGSGHLDSHNNESSDYTTSTGNQRRRVREWDPDDGSEVYAWQYGSGLPSSFPYTGRLVERGEFWFNLNGSSFEVWQGSYPVEDTWHVGGVGAVW